MSNEMKLIIESWRINQLLLEADQKSVISLVKNIADNKISNEKVQQIFDKLEKKEDFLKLVNIFKKLEQETIEEGTIDDAGAALSVKGMQLVDYIKKQPGGSTLIKASAPIMALAYMYFKFETSGGEINPDDVQNTITIATKGSNTNVVDIASSGG